MAEKKTIEDYLIDMINQRYAKRVFSQLATEHDKNFADLGKDPDYREYEWMVKRVLEIHRSQNIRGEGNDQEKQN